MEIFWEYLVWTKALSITKKDIDNYLKEAAPNFYKNHKNKELTENGVVEYLDERYDQVIQILKSFSSIKKTIFNLGNHESKHHFLVFQELAFLTSKEIPRIPDERLDASFKLFESKLEELEKTNDFKHISNGHLVENGTIILGIPGMSHATEGNDPYSIIQEEHTRNLINNMILDLKDAHSIVIYNHTQGNYDKNTGKYKPASESVNKLLANLPSNIKQKIFVQSHNHWAHTQFIKDKGTHFILNNAGLHDGIFNMISFNSLGVECYDVDPNTKNTTKLMLSTQQKNVESDVELISRFYPDPNIVLARKGNKKEKQKQDNNSINVLDPQKVGELKKKIFG